MPQIINVSAYDPKEKQRSRAPLLGARCLRAEGERRERADRAGRQGRQSRREVRQFLASADRVGMLPGVYYRLQTHVDAVVQADQFVGRARKALARSRSWNAPSLLLCGDFDAKSRMSDILRFMDRVERRTGVVPVAYLENSTHLKQLLGSADAATKAKLRRMPYWLALYSRQRRRGFPPRASDGLAEPVRRLVRTGRCGNTAAWIGSAAARGPRSTLRPGSVPALLRQSRSSDGAQCLQWQPRFDGVVLEAPRSETEVGCPRPRCAGRRARRGRPRPPRAAPSDPVIDSGCNGLSSSRSLCAWTCFCPGRRSALCFGRRMADKARCLRCFVSTQPAPCCFSSASPRSRFPLDRQSPGRRHGLRRR